MAEIRSDYKIRDDELSKVQVSDEVVTIIAGLAATEVEGVVSMGGNITNELVSRLGMKNLAKGVRIELGDGTAAVDLTLNIEYGYSIPEISAKVQDRVKVAVENMTGLDVVSVNIRIANVVMENNE
ncbi:MAG: Asp23/Gls24 family envelope stress response protein [Lachnospiraceae bacterium]|nr:Asp23/Gls24 family envelope stress response protein [Lachnospiraceae bacterium]